MGPIQMSEKQFDMGDIKEIPLLKTHLPLFTSLHT